MILKIIFFATTISFSYSIYASSCNEFLVEYAKGRPITEAGAIDMHYSMMVDNSDLDSFNQGRGFTSYIRRFHAVDKSIQDDLIKAFHRLEPDQHWLDMGSGFAVAQREFTGAIEKGYTNLENFLNEHGKEESRRIDETYQGFATSVTLYLPEREAQNLRNAANNRFRPLLGRSFQDIPPQELGHAHLITDVFGVLTYSPFFDKDLKKALDLLVVDGEMFFVLEGSTAEWDYPSIDGLYGHTTHDLRLTHNDSHISLYEVLKRIPGLSIKAAVTTRYKYTGLVSANAIAFKIRKSKEYNPDNFPLFTQNLSAYLRTLKREFDVSFQ